MQAPARTHREQPAAEQPVSTLAMRIVQQAARPDVSLQELGRLAEGDPGFAVRVLALVNSPAFGIARQVGDIRQAVCLVGIRSMRNLALSLVLTELAPRGEEGEVMLANCIRRAVAARAIAQHLSLANVDDCFTAGLLLESGILVSARRDLGGAVQAAQAVATSRPVVEQSAGHPPHTERGARLARDWNLGEELANAIAHHHDEALPTRGTLHGVAWAAERVAAIFEGGDLHKTRQAALDALEALGLGTDAAEALIAELPSTVSAAAHALSRPLGPQPSFDALLLNANQSLVDLNHQYEQMVRRLEGVLAERAELTRKLEQANARLEALATTDALTGLSNRRAFEARLQAEVKRARRYRRPLSIVLLDIDRFKALNDRYGHPAGDAVLAAVGACLLEGTRDCDLAARYGGEEFGIVLPDTAEAGALVLAERLRVQLASVSAQTTRGAVRITASFGVAALGGSSTNASTLIERADQALYMAKNRGRDQVMAWAEEAR